MGQPPSGGGWGQPPGYDPNQGYNQGYPQQQQGYPQQQGQQPSAQPPVAPKKKKSGAGCLIAALMLPVLGVGGWLVYQHFFNWGYLRAPDEVKAYVDPSVEELQKIAAKAAAACATANDDGELLDNPLKDAKVLESKGFRAARVQCRKGWSDPTNPFKPLDEAHGDAFTVSINNQEGFKCMAPNFFGIGDNSRSDCVMWKGPSVAYLVERASIGTMKAEIRVEWGPESADTKSKKKKSSDDDE